MTPAVSAMRVLHAEIAWPASRRLSYRHVDGRPGLAVADIDLDPTDPDIDVAVRLSRTWRRTATAELYAGRTAAGDPRSVHRTAF